MAGLPPSATRWTGRVKYDFTGGNNDPDALRDFLVGKFKRDAGINCSADDILITSK